MNLNKLKLPLAIICCGIAMSLLTTQCKKKEAKLPKAIPMVSPSNALLVETDSCYRHNSPTVAELNELLIGKWKLIGVSCRSHKIFTATIYLNISANGQYSFGGNTTGTWKLTEVTDSNGIFNTSPYDPDLLGDRVQLCGDDLLFFDAKGAGCVAHYRRD